MGGGAARRPKPPDVVKMENPGARPGASGVDTEVSNQSGLCVISSRVTQDSALSRIRPGDDRALSRIRLAVSGTAGCHVFRQASQAKEVPESRSFCGAKRAPSVLFEGLPSHRRGEK